MKKWILILSLPLVLSAQEYYGEVPQHFSAKVLKKSTELTLKDLGEMELEIQYPLDYQMKEVALAQEDSDIHYFLGASSLSEPIENLIKQNILICYEPLVEGHYHLDLPILEFESKVDPGKKQTLYPPSIECEVKMSSEDPFDELKIASPLTLEIAPPIELNLHNKRALFQKSGDELKEIHQKLLLDAPTLKWKWLALATFFGFLGYQGYQWMKLRRKGQKIFSLKLDPKERALRALQDLKAKNLPKKGMYDAFYVEITQIVRHYIEGYYQIKAPEQTTQEFLKVMLGQSIFNEKINHYLTEFLKFADLVKFAKLHPQIEDCSQAEEAAESFILSESEK